MFFPQLVASFVCVTTGCYVLVKRSLVTMNDTFNVSHGMLILFPRTFVLMFLRATRRATVIRIISMGSIVGIEGV